MTARKRRRSVKLGVGCGADVVYTEIVCDDCSRRLEIPHGVRPSDGLAAYSWLAIRRVEEKGMRHRCPDCEERINPRQCWRAEPKEILSGITPAKGAGHGTQADRGAEDGAGREEDRGEAAG